MFSVFLIRSCLWFMIMDFLFSVVLPRVLTHVWTYDDDYWFALNKCHAEKTLFTHTFHCPASLSLASFIKCLLKWNDGGLDAT